MKPAHLSSFCLQAAKETPIKEEEEEESER